MSSLKEMPLFEQILRNSEKSIFFALDFKVSCIECLVCINILYGYISCMYKYLVWVNIICLYKSFYTRYYTYKTSKKN